MSKTNLLYEARRAAKSVNKLLEIINRALGTNYKSHHFYSWASGSSKTPATAQGVMRRLVILNLMPHSHALMVLEAIEPPKLKGGEILGLSIE